MVPLQRPEGLAMCWAGDISADGWFVSGWGGNSFGTSTGWEGVRWDNGDISDRLTLSGGGIITHAISGDGDRIVGTRTIVVNNKPMDRAFVWTPVGGFFDLGGLIAPDCRTTTTGISQDGRVILGDCIDDALGTRTVFIWTIEEGVVPMGDIFSADALSRDGSVIVGTMLSPLIFQAFRWTAADGVVPIPTPGENNQSRAQGVSGDGSVVVGYVESNLDETRWAFMWDQTHGMRNVKEVLESEYGLNLAGWTLLVAWDISDDGTTIVGRGRNPQGFEEAWRAVLPNRTPVGFADANLRAAVEAALGVTDPTVEDMKRLTQLDARSKQITNLTGLEHAIHLKKLELKNNQIEDISALGNLTELEVLDLGRNQVVEAPLWGLVNLRELDLDDNHIGNIYPLTRLTRLIELELQGNPLNRGAYCRDLQTIRDNNPQITLTYDENPSSLEGDFNRDCAVNLDDLMLLAGEWLKSDCGSCKADTDGNGIVSMPDFDELSENWRI
jgi:uncharacterized membrane protein